MYTPTLSSDPHVRCNFRHFTFPLWTSERIQWTLKLSPLPLPSLPLTPPSRLFSLCLAEQLSQPLKPHPCRSPATRGLIFFPKFLSKLLFYRNNSFTEKNSGTFSTTLCMCVCLCVTVTTSVFVMSNGKGEIAGPPWGRMSSFACVSASISFSKPPEIGS